LRTARSSGAAAEVFGRMVGAMGGPADLVERPDLHLPAAPITVEVYAERPGVVTGMDVRSLGWAVVSLGGGRTKPGAAIDPAVGLTDLAQVGAEVGSSASKTPLAVVHAADSAAAEAAASAVRSAYALAEPGAPNPSATRPLIIETIR
jgi:thymidine phosphorylase